MHQVTDCLQSETEMDRAKAIRVRILETKRLLRDAERLLRAINTDIDLSLFEEFTSHNEFELAWCELNAVASQGNSTPDIHNANPR
jgi:hypothetical protein